MALSDLEWTNKVTEAVLSAVPGIFGVDASLSSKEPERIDRRYSFMFRYQIDVPKDRPRTVLVKIPHESWMNTMDEAIRSEHIRDVTQDEFDVMTSIANVIESSNVLGLFAIRPKVCFPELGALLVEEYSLRMLKTSLTKLPIVLGRRNSWKEFEKHVELAGVWLKLIHQSSDHGQTRKLSALGISERANQEFSALEKISGKSLNKLKEDFQLLYGSLQGNEIPLASLHNDYHLGNVFVLNDGRIGVLDPNWEESGSVYTDLASLLIDPVTRKLQVLSLGLLFRSSMYKRYENAVLRGYFGELATTLPMLYFYCTYAVLEKWRTDEEMLLESSSKVRRFLSRLAAPIIRFYFHGLMLRYLERGFDALEFAGE